MGSTFENQKTSTHILVLVTGKYFISYITQYFIFDSDLKFVRLDLRESGVVSPTLHSVERARM